MCGVFAQILTKTPGILRRVRANWAPSARTFGRRTAGCVYSTVPLRRPSSSVLVGFDEKETESPCTPRVTGQMLELERDWIESATSVVVLV